MNEHGASFDYNKYIESLVYLAHIAGHLVPGNVALTAILFCRESKSTHLVSLHCSFQQPSERST
jgi:hypothetical protein